MKKSIALLALCAAGSACAQQARITSSVTISGNINAQFESISAPDATNALSAVDSARVERRTRANQNASELRFSGKRDVGDGMEGFFTIGSEIQSFSGGNANNTSTFAIRNTGVGLRGNFGEVAIGRWDSHYHWNSILVDTAFINAGLAIDSKSLISYVNGTVFIGNRFSNAIRYNTPSISGLTGHVIFSRNDGTVTNVAGIGNLADKSTNLALTYVSGPIRAFVSYFDRRDASVVLPFAAVATASSMSQKSSKAGINFDVGNGVAVGVIIDQTKQVHMIAVGQRDMRRVAWAVPVRYQTGQHLFSATYGAAQDSSGTLMTASAVGTNADTGARFFSLGYQYLIDKATSVNLGFGQIKNKVNGSYDLSANGALGINGFAATRGADPRSFQAGMKYTF